jgi:hypothetical protein
VLDAACVLYEKTVQIPPAEYSQESLAENPKRWPFFQGCIGALDGTHLPISISSSQQGMWRNRKGWISQNILAVCDFDMNFVYIFAGMEGSANDCRVLEFAEERDNFADLIPSNCYFLADAGYLQSHPLVITPYNGVRYHLKEFEKTAKRPVNAKELFNLRHASLRNLVERVFGVFKRRFQIYDRARDGYSILTQVKLVFALTAIHNFMNKYGEDTILSSDDEANEDEDMDEAAESVSTRETVNMVEKRDQIAKDMWDEYINILNERENITY